MAGSVKYLPTLTDRPRGSWWEFALLSGAALLPVAALIAGAPAGLTVTVLAAALVALQWFVWRRGGWRLIGPHSYYDLIRLSRKGRGILLRTLFLLALLGGIGYSYQRALPMGINIDDVDGDEPVIFLDRGAEIGGGSAAIMRERLAQFNTRCVYTWFLLQNITILLLTPAYVGGAIAEERERGTLDSLLTTCLYNREIALGKLLARLVHLGMFLIAPVPVFSIMLVWGGIDLWLLLAGWINGLLLLLTACSVCLMFSTMPVRASTAVLVSYAVLLPSGACCVGLSYEGLQEFLLNGANNPLFILAMVYVLVIGISLLIAVMAVRPPELPPDPAAATPWNPWVGPTSPATDQAEQRLPSLAPIVTRTATELSIDFPRRPRLPPIGEDALMWKERYTGGRSLLLIPEVLAAAATPMIIAILVFCASVDQFIRQSDKTLPGTLADLAESVGGWLQAFYALFLMCYCIGVAFRAATCIVRERQMRTLDMLLQLPIERREILRAKWLGTLLKGWPWLALLLGDLIIGLLTGAYHPVSFLFMLVFPLPLILALCGVGLFISTLVRTVGQANLAMAGTLLALVVAATGTRPELVLGYSAFTCTWWQSPRFDASEMLAAGVSVVVLLCTAASARGLAGRLFERLGRY